MTTTCERQLTTYEQPPNDYLYYLITTLQQKYHFKSQPFSQPIYYHN
jgi:hypothetical protein